MPETDFEVAIIGAGPAGLTAAWRLGKDQKRRVIVLEADPLQVGGICKTVVHNDFRFDIGGHRFFSKSSEVEALWDEILPDPEDFLVRRRRSRILYRNRFFSYPLKPLEALFGLGLRESIRCAGSYLKARIQPNKDPASFEDWVSNQFGHRLYSIFFKTYTEKVWGMPCSEISADWAAQRIKGLNLAKAVLSSLFPHKSGDGEVVKTLINEFRYPKHGPGMMWERCAEKVEFQGGVIELDRKVVELGYETEAQSWTIISEDQSGERRTIAARHVVSTAPMRELITDLIRRPEPDQSAIKAADALHYRDFLTVAVMVEDDEEFSDQWIYIHDPDIQAGRIQNFKSWSPEMVPREGVTCYGLEYFCFARDEGLWAMTNEELASLAAAELSKLGMIASTDCVIDACVVRQKKAYPVYDEHYADHIAMIRDEVECNYPNLHLIGRNGMHQYNNQDHSMMTALLCAENIIAGKEVYDLWGVNQDAKYIESGEEEDLRKGMRSVPEKL